MPAAQLADVLASLRRDGLVCALSVSPDEVAQPPLQQIELGAAPQLCDRAPIPLRPKNKCKNQLTCASASEYNPTMPLLRASVRFPRTNKGLQSCIPAAVVVALPVHA